MSYLHQIKKCILLSSTWIPICYDKFVRGNRNTVYDTWNMVVTHPKWYTNENTSARGILSTHMRSFGYALYMQWFEVELQIMLHDCNNGMSIFNLNIIIWHYVIYQIVFWSFIRCLLLRIFLNQQHVRLVPRIAFTFDEQLAQMESGKGLANPT